jgi:hypothetical protein
MLRKIVLARNVLAGGLIVSLAVILLVSDRDWVFSDQHRAVAHVADIPAQANGEIGGQLDEIVAFGGVHVPHPGTKAEQIYRLLVLAGRVPPPPVEEYQRPRYGYSVREITFLGMPFAWFSEYGFALYARDRNELVVAPLVPGADAKLHQEAGRDLRQGFFFPFWAHAWGWLFLAGLALWGLLYHRSIVLRREAEGLI